MFVFERLLFSLGELHAGFVQIRAFLVANGPLSIPEETTRGTGETGASFRSMTSL